MVDYQKELSKVSDTELEKLIVEANATLVIEGMPLTEKDKDIIRRYAKGEYSIEDAIRVLREK